MEYKWVEVLFVFELCVSLLIILCCKYTEVDWKTYMQEVRGFLDGELDYTKLKGNTGPLVYPGGFVWSYSALYFITKGGDVAMARWIYTGIHLFFFALVSRLYVRCNVKGYFFIGLLLSRRIRSLFLLRFFNDCWTMLILYFAVVVLATGRRWELGCLLYSISVSVKMNTFLFAPGLFFILCKSLPLLRVIFCLFIFFIWQVFVAFPFILHDKKKYIARSFELGRVFTYRWSVNFKMISEETFVSKEFSLILLLLTVFCWFLVWRLRWSKRIFIFSNASRAKQVSNNSKKANKKKVFDSDVVVYRNIVLTMFESNLIGTMLSRSLHYQFFVWFFHSMPLVLSATRLPFLLQVAVFGLVQYAFETYPSTAQSSFLLQCGFALALFGILFLGKEESARRFRLPFFSFFREAAKNMLTN